MVAGYLLWFSWLVQSGCKGAGAASFNAVPAMARCCVKTVNGALTW
jgi:hypothetical protein